MVGFACSTPLLRTLIIRHEQHGILSQLGFIRVFTMLGQPQGAHSPGNRQLRLQQLLTLQFVDAAAHFAHCIQLAANPTPRQNRS